MQYLDLLASTTQFILETTLKASILTILILLIQVSLRKRIPAKWLHALWLLLLIRLLIPFELESKLSIFNLIPDTNNQRVVESTPVSLQVSPPVFETNSKTEEQSLNTISNIPEAYEPELKLLPIHYVSIVWIFGVIVLIKFTVSNNLIFRNKIRNKRKIINKEILDLFHRCKKEMKIKTEIGLVEVDTTSVPLLYGVFRPQILLPSNFIHKINLSELKHIFLHELAHYKRWDIYFELLTSILQILHWFNPVVWYAFYRMRIDRELATDERTLSVIGSEKSRAYGHTLLSMLKQI